MKGKAQPASVSAATVEPFRVPTKAEIRKTLAEVYALRNEGYTVEVKFLRRPAIIAIEVTPPAGETVVHVLPRTEAWAREITKACAKLGINDVPGYTGKAPSPSPADTSRRDRMGEDFETDLAVSRYELLARRVDLLNPKLPDAVKETRAERLVTAYKRLRKLKPDFRDTGDQLRAARRIRMAAYRRGKTPKEARRAAI